LKENFKQSKTGEVSMVQVTQQWFQDLRPTDYIVVSMVIGMLVIALCSKRSKRKKPHMRDKRALNLEHVRDEHALNLGIGGGVR
jgi:hypothetical protein